MIGRPRLIPILLINDKNLIKTIKFKGNRYLGDPINAIKIFNEKEVDELAVIDKGISINKRTLDFDYLKDVASEAFMPLSYGGGVNSLMKARKLFSIGFEKVIIGTALFESPKVVKEIVDLAGSQSVVAAIDYKTNIFGKKTVYYKNGTINSKKTPLEACKYAEDLGVGEIILTSINHEGKMCGFDNDVIKECANSIEIPLVAHGGANGLDDIYKAIRENGASAIAAGSMFSFYGKMKAVLINYPKYDELLKKGIYKDEPSM